MLLVVAAAAVVESCATAGSIKVHPRRRAAATLHAAARPTVDTAYCPFVTASAFYQPWQLAKSPSNFTHLLTRNSCVWPVWSPTLATNRTFPLPLFLFRLLYQLSLTILYLFYFSHRPWENFYWRSANLFLILLLEFTRIHDGLSQKQMRIKNYNSYKKNGWFWSCEKRLYFKFKYTNLTYFTVLGLHRIYREFSSLNSVFFFFLI